MTSLNPVLSIGEQVMEPLLIHMKMSDEQARARAIELLQLVGITDGPRRLEQYPHQLSGGMRQRVMIAIGLACNPEAPDRRRADHRARRHHPGADPRTDEGPVAPARHRAGHHHAQSRDRGALRRPRERDVCGAHRRAGLGRQCLPRTRAPLCDRADALDPAARRAARRQARDDRGPAAGPARAAGRLPLRAALPYRLDACLQSAPLAEVAPGHASACIRAKEIAAGTLVPPQRCGRAQLAIRSRRPSRC